MGRLGHLWRHYAIAGAIFVVGAALTALVAVNAREAEEQNIRSALDRSTNSQLEEFKLKLDDATVSVEALADYISTQRELLPEEFHDFAKIARGDDPVARLSWAPIVEDRDRAAFEAAGKIVNASDYEIREVAADGGLRAAPKRDEFAPILHDERFEEGESALGFDLLSEPSGRAAAVASRDSGAPVFTISYLSSTTQSRRPINFVLYWPVYRSGQPPTTLEERRANLVGFARGVFPLREFTNFVFSDAGALKETIYLRVGDTMGPSKIPSVVYHPAELKQAALGEEATRLPPQGDLNVARELQQFGTTWTVNFDYAPASVAAVTTSNEWALPALGALLTLFVSGYVLLQGRGKAVVEAEVAARTHDLAEATERLRAASDELSTVLAASPVAIVVIDPQQRILSWNDTAERMTGYSAAESSATRFRTGFERPSQISPPALSVRANATSFMACNPAPAARMASALSPVHR